MTYLTDEYKNTLVNEDEPIIGNTDEILEPDIDEEDDEEEEEDPLQKEIKEEFGDEDLGGEVYT